MAARRHPAWRRLQGRHAALATVALCSFQAALSLARGRVTTFVGIAASGGGIAGDTPSTRRYAEDPKVKDEPDFGKEVGKFVKDTLGLDEVITPEDRVTPIDRWFGWDKAILQGRDESDPFIDSSDELNYVTIQLEKPMGIEFVENPRQEGGGVVVGEVRPGYSAHATGVIRTGYHLVVADDTPVFGLPFEEAIRPIIEKEGPVKLTFFMGDAVYFYGEFRPGAAWLDVFLEKLKGPIPDAQ